MLKYLFNKASSYGYIISLLVLVFLAVLLVAPSVLAISNPNTITFGTGSVPLYRVFENVYETGDMLFVAEGYVYYAVEPTDYTASEAFLFELLNTTGTTTLLSVPINEYGNRPISIYQTAAQVTALGLVSGTAYGFRITGNPTIFPSPTGNTVTVYLAASDYVDQLLGVDGGVATANPLRNFLISMAENIEDEDAPPAGSEYIITVTGVRYLTTDGGDIFLAGIPGLSVMCPILFQSVLNPITSDDPAYTGAYAATLTPATQWGTTVGNGLSALGDFMGISQALAGSVLLLLFVTFFSFYLYRKTESGVTVLLLVAAMPFIGSFMGLMPLALAFIFAITIVVLMGYYFLSRGAL